MARELLKLPNNKKGFVMLLILEALVAAWALTATLYALSAGRTRTVIYGFIVLFAIFYILGRSLRSFRNLQKQERAQKEQDGQAK
ncbi:MAG: hypothetical protein IJV43_09885 [Oscillospiraceae bacterium]|nr:hypothetical protein [Oscillospiraceae bacterium]